jgi:hypothetical protein
LNSFKQIERFLIIAEDMRTIRCVCHFKPRHDHAA